MWSPQLHHAVAILPHALASSSLSWSLAGRLCPRRDGTYTLLEIFSGMSSLGRAWKRQGLGEVFSFMFALAPGPVGVCMSPISYVVLRLRCETRPTHEYTHQTWHYLDCACPRGQQAQCFGSHFPHVCKLGCLTVPLFLFWFRIGNLWGFDVKHARSVLLILRGMDLPMKHGPAGGLGKG